MNIISECINFPHISSVVISKSHVGGSLMQNSAPGRLKHWRHKRIHRRAFRSERASEAKVEDLRRVQPLQGHHGAVVRRSDGDVPVRRRMNTGGA